MSIRKNIFAFIPARKNSKRIKNKNIYNLNGHPLLAYTIENAIKSNCFKKIFCITDDVRYANIANYYGAETPILRPKKISEDTSPDIEWVKWFLKYLLTKNSKCDAFSILRPTSPIRSYKTIRDAVNKFYNSNKTDSLRAVEKCKQHPGKMWIHKKKYITPLISKSIKGTPWHSSQYASLPVIYEQNASLEIAWSKTVKDYNSISGKKIIPFFPKNQIDGFDINTEEDLDYLKFMIKNKKISLIKIKKKSWFNL